MKNEGAIEWPRKIAGAKLVISWTWDGARLDVMFDLEGPDALDCLEGSAAPCTELTAQAFRQAINDLYAGEGSDISAEFLAIHEKIETKILEEAGGEQPEKAKKRRSNAGKPVMEKMKKRRR